MYKLLTLPSQTSQLSAPKKCLNVLMVMATMMTTCGPHGSVYFSFCSACIVKIRDNRYCEVGTRAWLKRRMDKRKFGQDRQPHQPNQRNPCLEGLGTHCNICPFASFFLFCGKEFGVGAGRGCLKRFIAPNALGTIVQAPALHMRFSNINGQ